MARKKQPQFLYSTGTELSNKINKKYYNGIHYVWCTSKFDDINQPPTSNPSTICKRYLEQIVTGDKHAHEIDNNIVGILKGANEKLKKNVITQEQLDEIKFIVGNSEYNDYMPVIYIIDYRKVKSRCKAVPASEKASDESEEFLVEDLKEGEYELLRMQSILNTVVKENHEKAGK